MQLYFVTSDASLGCAFVLFLSLVPVGCGSGTTGNGSGPAWNYSALGDSLAAGALAQLGYVPRYATYVNTDTSATVTTLNLGIPGWQSGDLLNALQKDPVSATRFLVLK